MEDDSIVNMFQKILDRMETVLTKVKIIEKKVAKSDERMKDIEEAVKQIGDMTIKTANAIKEVSTVSIKTADKEAFKKLETISLDEFKIKLNNLFTIFIEDFAKDLCSLVLQVR